MISDREKTTRDRILPDLRRWSLLVSACCALGLPATVAFGQTPATGQQQIAYVEQMVTTYRPTQQRVIVPVREYRTETRLHGWWNPFREPYVAQRQVPVTRWVERIQTTAVPVAERRYRPVIETSTRVMPPIEFAARPQASSAPAAPRLYDDLPMVAAQAPATKSAQPTPTTALVPQPLKPASRSPNTGLRPLSPR